MIYKKVNTADRLPEEDGTYITDIGELPFRNGEFLWGISDGRLCEMTTPPEYWMEPIDLPSEEEIQTAIEAAECKILIETDEILSVHQKYKAIAKMMHKLMLSKLK